MKGFDDLDAYYPGSKEKRQTVPESCVIELWPTPLEEAFDALGDPITMTVKGRDIEFFYIGALARALGRSAVTLRRWEDNGVIPRSGYTKPSPDPRGKRRLYSRAQCEGIIQLAWEEGILNSKKPIGAKFTVRVTALFRELKGKK